MGRERPIFAFHGVASRGGFGAGLQSLFPDDLPPLSFPIPREYNVRVRPSLAICCLATVITVLAGCKRPHPQAPSPSPLPSVATPSPTASPARTFQPYRQFIHVSELYKEGVSEHFGRAYSVAATATDGTLISIDQNESPEEIEALRHALSGKKVAYCLYVDGPGGPTGEHDEYDADELMRLTRRAKPYLKSKITDPKNRFVLADGTLSPREEDYQGHNAQELDKLPWMKEWNSSGWPRYFQEVTLPQMRGVTPFTGNLKQVFVAAEIDNLYRHLQAAGISYGQFLDEYASWVTASGHGKPSPAPEIDLHLILKNLNYDDAELGMVKGLLEYSKKHGRDLFAGIHVAESDRDDFPGRKELDAQLAKVGVITVVSLDTTDYVATTFPNLRKELNDAKTLTRLETEVARSGRVPNRAGSRG